MKKILFVLLCFPLFLSIAADKDRYFEMAKNLEIFSSLYKELNTYYVDDIDPNKLMNNGINKMLDGLDPFTNYITGADIDEYQLQTTGKYGGVGARIGRIGTKTIITEPYEGYPAQKAGLQAGDELLEIDGKSCSKYNSDDVSELLKGEPGTKVSVKVKKAVTGEEKTYNFERAEIKLQNVTYSGMVNDKIGYIKLVTFTDNAAQEVQNALTELKKNPNLKGVILDLRGNGGGLLNEAINICNTFVDKGTTIVSTKGKAPETNFDYPTMNKALDTEIPLAILTDEGSASASEIVSGSMQDLDRAVIIGQNTYGKGLVQITRPLAYKARLKVTISKYYIPSGRCIQRIDYSHRDDNGVATAVPDSLRKEFKTKNGRTVKDGAGIEPDIKTDVETLSAVATALYYKNHFFNFANQYFVDHPQLRGGNDFTMTDEEYDQFVNYLKGKDYDYTTESEQKLGDLKKTVKEENFSDAVTSELSDLETKIKHDKEKDLVKFKPEIKRILEQEIVSRYNYEKGRIANGLKDDPDVKKAIEVLGDPLKYKGILSAHK